MGLWGFRDEPGEVPVKGKYPSARDISDIFTNRSGAKWVEGFTPRGLNRSSANEEIWSLALECDGDRVS